ncbi:MAG: gamma-glutamyl-gamma-aminobutyrate hydrolase family protein [Bacillaceae bacterium]
MKKPVIGITTSYVKHTERSEGVYVHWDYHQSVERLGGIPLLLPTVLDEDSIAYYGDLCDGFLFSGGEDVNPKYFGQMPHEKLGYFWDDRDRFEFALFKKAEELKKPIFGICRGLQLINVARGGTLFQHIDGHFTSIQRHLPYHEVDIAKGSLLYDIIGSEKVDVNSLHHQTIDVLGERLIVTSSSKDGQIEAIEDPNYPFLVAVQWHPESMSSYDEKMARLFLAFFAASQNDLELDREGLRR